MVDRYGLWATFPYLDNVTNCGHDQQDHDTNLRKFLQTAKFFNLTYNKDKCVFSTDRLAILGYVVRNGVIGHDPECMRPLMEFPLPHCSKALKRCLGFFPYYDQWVPKYADMAHPRTNPQLFPCR
ncbi:hypothetical protein scyTo_0000246 [Scyliorhinus torazame]|uniref:Reverse transcriptase domain-containing protein n=1 Tax=Scyliorhinus torazame TaxID=75743 RepID=A0A401NTF6_SCYTO|nr:hypothetical protein [Scyliorhinus torazame]